MASRLTKKQQTELTEKLMGVIQKNNALQLRLSADRSVNEMNVNQISGALNRIHGQAIGKELPTVINIPVKQLGSGYPSPDNIRPFVGYEIDGIGTVYGGELNIGTGVLTVTYGIVDLRTLTWIYQDTVPRFYTIGLADSIVKPTVNTEVGDLFCSNYKTGIVPTAITPDKEIGVATSGNLFIKDTNYTDIATFETAMTGVMLVYELATPETYILTSQQMLQLLDQL